MEYNENHMNDDKFIRAKKRVDKMKGFYAHLAVYIIINLMLVLINSRHSGLKGALESMMTTGFFWGIGLFFHWYGVFGKELFFGKDWEKRKIKELMDEDDREKWV